MGSTSNIKGHINIQRVHEIDPEQLRFLLAHKNISLDTSATPRKELRFDAWFIVGFHHTHAALAISAMEQGAYAVIEKPLVTTTAQYEEFIRKIEYLPLHPEVKVRMLEGNQATLEVGGNNIVIAVDGNGELNDVKSSCHPEFGLSVESRRLVYYSSGVLPIEIITRIHW